LEGIVCLLFFLAAPAMRQPLLGSQADATAPPHGNGQLAEFPFIEPQPDAEQNADMYYYICTFFILIRQVPNCKGPLTGETISKGQVFGVSEVHQEAGDQQYLRLADGRGWVSTLDRFGHCIAKPASDMEVETRSSAIVVCVKPGDGMYVRMRHSCLLKSAAVILCIFGLVMTCLPGEDLHCILGGLMFLGGSVLMVQETSKEKKVNNTQEDQVTWGQMWQNMRHSSAKYYYTVKLEQDMIVLPEPDIRGKFATGFLSPGQVFGVSKVMQAEGETRKYLLLSDGLGWAYTIDENLKRAAKPASPLEKWCFGVGAVWCLLKGIVMVEAALALILNALWVAKAFGGLHMLGALIILAGICILASHKVYDIYAWIHGHPQLEVVKDDRLFGHVIRIIILLVPLLITIIVFHKVES